MIVIGFASQRLLVDVIAGFFILFEDQYGVGDVDPAGAQRLHRGRCGPWGCAPPC